MSFKKPSQTALRRLLREYKDLASTPTEGIVAAPIGENLLDWEAYIAGPSGTPYEGGVFRALLLFPTDYPLSPPRMKFTTEVFHPNIYENGEVCISILHQPGEDPNMYEHSSERWSPVQSVEKILLSVVSMLSEPNPESGANLEACRYWRGDRKGYDQIVRKNVEKSLELFLAVEEETVARKEASKMVEGAMRLVFK